MKTFVTAKNRKAINNSMNEISEALCKNHTLNDDETLANLEELKKRLDHMVEYMRTARLFTQFYKSKGEKEF